jgi:hypothetical protein
MTWPGCAGRHPAAGRGLAQSVGACAGLPDRATRPGRRAAAAARQCRRRRAPLQLPAGVWMAACSTAPTRTAIRAGTARARSQSCCQPTACSCSQRRARACSEPARHGDRSMRFPAPAASCCIPPACPGRTAQATSAPMPTISSTGWWPPASAVADPAAGRHRAGQLALHEQLGLRRQRAADRPAGAAAARLAGGRGLGPATGFDAGG